MFKLNFSRFNAPRRVPLELRASYICVSRSSTFTLSILRYPSILSVSWLPSCTSLVPAMPLLSKVLTFHYTGRRLHQLRTDPPRIQSRFFPWGDYLLDDLRALEIPRPDFVNVSSDGRMVEYTWNAYPDWLHSKATSISCDIFRVRGLTVAYHRYWRIRSNSQWQTRRAMSRLFAS